MGEEKTFEPWKLFAGLLVSDGYAPVFDENLKLILTEHFGPVDYESPGLPFTYTDYYRREMGENILRKFVSFENLVDPSELWRIKLTTNELEQRFAIRGRRVINIDPGILSLSRLLLATTKDNAHRIPLSGGIYAEITLLYRNKDFTALPWTYPDYQTSAYKEIFSHIRQIFKDQLKQAI